MTNPTEGELLTQLRAAAASGAASAELRLERANGENLRAASGSAPGLLRLSKDKGEGRGVFHARREVPLTEAERVFAAYLAGETDFDRGLKWQPAGAAWLGATARWSIIALALALVVLRSCV